MTIIRTVIAQRLLYCQDESERKPLRDLCGLYVLATGSMELLRGVCGLDTESAGSGETTAVEFVDLYVSGTDW
ncbi:hypothetical protein DPMN_041424 [Dreissena polymorpha]|uniref:Uncharacterized protein n=1 Tax=Dreissena polymorpha TaxID=45954 RepID=A0A9D4HW29_DREPO|nr:hypothetical protein DPMN_041424 [Dreissena polymorpha]